MKNPRYRRILLKLSGESMAGGRGFGVDPDTLNKIVQQVKFLHDSGFQIGIVSGAGNFFRGTSGTTMGVNRVTGDFLGMTATIMNSVFLQSALINLGCDARVLSAISIPQLTETYERKLALHHLKHQRLVIFAGGTGNPYFTTDSAAALRAVEINADLIIKGTRVNGVYDSDPEINPNAIKFDSLTFRKVIELELKVMDLTAVTLCRENDIPIIVLNIENEKYIKNFVAEIQVGTIITNN